MIMTMLYNRTTAALDWIYTNAMPFETCSRYFFVDHLYLYLFVLGTRVPETKRRPEFER